MSFVSYHFVALYFLLRISNFFSPLFHSSFFSLPFMWLVFSILSAPFCKFFSSLFFVFFLFAACGHFSYSLPSLSFGINLFFSLFIVPSRPSHSSLLFLFLPFQQLPPFPLFAKYLLSVFPEHFFLVPSSFSFYCCDYAFKISFWEFKEFFESLLFFLSLLIPVFK